MPALRGINEGVDVRFDPFSLVNYEEIDDYLLSLKARHKPEFRISEQLVITSPVYKEGKVGAINSSNRSNKRFRFTPRK